MPPEKVLLTIGVCRICGCTDEAACDGGCTWIDEKHTLCSSCSERSVILEETFDAIAHLEAAWGHLALAEGLALTPREHRLSTRLSTIADRTKGLSQDLRRLRKLLETR